MKVHLGKFRNKSLSSSRTFQNGTFPSLTRIPNANMTLKISPMRPKRRKMKTPNSTRFPSPIRIPTQTRTLDQFFVFSSFKHKYTSIIVLDSYCDSMTRYYNNKG